VLLHQTNHAFTDFDVDACSFSLMGSCITAHPAANDTLGFVIVFRTKMFTQVPSTPTAYRGGCGSGHKEHETRNMTARVKD